MLGAIQWKPGMIFTIEFFRIRPNDDARATLDRLSAIVDDLDAAKMKARSLFETLEMPQKPDGLRPGGRRAPHPDIWRLLGDRRRAPGDGAR